MMADFNELERIAWHRSQSESALRKLISDNSLGHALIAESEGKTCGYAVITYGYDLEFGGRDAFITELYLQGAVRGRGLGTVFLREIEKIAKDNGVLALHLMVYPDNLPAVSLYRRAGFIETPRVGMSKVLDRP